MASSTVGTAVAGLLAPRQARVISPPGPTAVSSVRPPSRKVGSCNSPPSTMRAWAWSTGTVNFICDRVARGNQLQSGLTAGMRQPGQQPQRDCLRLIRDSPRSHAIAFALDPRSRADDRRGRRIGPARARRASPSRNGMRTQCGSRNVIFTLIISSARSPVTVPVTSSRLMTYFGCCSSWSSCSAASTGR